MRYALSVLLASILLVSVQFTPASGITFRQILDSPYWDREPDICPGDSLVVFRSQRNGQWDLYLLNLNTDEVTRLTDSPETEEHPDWSPDGSLILYFSYVEGANQLFTITPDGETITQLTFDDELSYMPRWSSDGSRIFYQYGQVSGSGLRVLDLETMEIDDLIPREYEINMPAISGNDSLVCYYTGGQRAARVLMVSPIYDPDPVQITFPPWGRTAAMADWNPTGNWILYMSNPDTAAFYDVFMVTADGDSTVQLTDFETFCSDARWNFDGSKFVFRRRGEDGVYNLWIAEGIWPDAVVRGTVTPMGEDISPTGFTVRTANLETTPDEEGNYELSPVSAGNQTIEIVREGWENLQVQRHIEGGDTITDLDFDPWILLPPVDLVRGYYPDRVVLRWSHPHQVGEGLQGFRVEREGVILDSLLSEPRYEGPIPWSPALYHVWAIYRGGQVRTEEGILYDPEAEVVNRKNGIPETYRVYGPFPNPFNPSTSIGIDLPETGRLTITVFDRLGRKVDTIVNGVVQAGTYTTTWEPSPELASGIYFVEIHAGSYGTSLQRAVLMR